MSIKFFFMLMILTAFFPSCLNNKANEKPVTPAYKPVSQELFSEIYRMDSTMFAAFNEHSADKIMLLFSDNLEFYHDKGGLSDFNKTKESFRKLFDNNKTTGLRRDLVNGSFEVYPINEYGAVETCLHRFCHVENGKDDCGTFKNIMVWKKFNGTWKVTRVISYDH